MSYIAAYHCKTGIVMCADTQETVGDNKRYIEKILTIDDRAYPLAVGGAGYGPLLDATMQEIIDRTRESKPKTKTELRSLLNSCLKEVYEKDVPALAVPAKHRSPELLVAAKPPEDDFCILSIKARRVLGEPRTAIIGYATAYNTDLLNRLHRESLSMQQAVMLGVYLVSQSKRLDQGVGGETSIAVVVENGAWIDDPKYVKDSEGYVSDFLKLTDELFFNCIDVTIPPKQFPERLTEFTTRANVLRESHLKYSAARMLNRIFNEPGYKGDAYRKIFAGAKTTLRSDFSVEVSDEPIPDYLKKAFESPMFGLNDNVGELPESLQAVMTQNSEGLWELKITKKEPC
jgi:20S proteasome alpha/beta subunit